MEKVNVAMVNRPMNEDWTHDGEISPIGISPTILNGLPCTVSDPNDGSDNVVSSAASNHASEVNAVRKQAEHPNNTYTTTTTTILTENKSKSIPKARYICGSSKTCSLKSANKFHHLHVYNFDPLVNSEDVKSYLGSLGYTSCTVVALKSKRPEAYSSFRVSDTEDIINNLKCPDVWPENVRAKRYIFRTQSTSATFFRPDGTARQEH